MFNAIVTLAHERPITAADFKPFVGNVSYLAFCKGEPLGNCDAYPDAAILSGIVYKFKLMQTLELCNKVHIKLQHADSEWESMTMDADELAIRMDES